MATISCQLQRQSPLCQPSTSSLTNARSDCGCLAQRLRHVPRLNYPSRRVIVRAEQATKESSNPAETTEKFGLEAGLWQVFRSKDANGVSRTDQAKQLLKTYGSAYLLTSISFAIVSFAACYALVTAVFLHGLATQSSFTILKRLTPFLQLLYIVLGGGWVDIGALLEKVGIQVNSTSEKVGTVAIAYAAHKALSPVRFPPTVALTPVVARLLGRNTSTTLSPNADSNVDDVKK